ncbi:uncharacterized protein LOC143031067 [Oratosquilla oratoria]|uniref:uncharacterized protein LOC143031067 n=1 Tax=Oratosquilla oratoria TaxID=337810 RepID=UPI003F76892D
MNNVFISESSQTSNDVKMILVELKTLLSVFARFETVLENQSKMLQEMLHILNSKENNQMKEVVGHEDLGRLDAFLPVKTLEDFNQVKAELEANADFEQLLYCRLSRQGGSNVKMSVKCIIDSCLMDDSQKKFNWEGRVGWKTKDDKYKIGFKPTKLCNIITRVLLDNRNFQTTEDEIGKTIMKYLRNASGRCGGRQRRSNINTSTSSDTS